MAANKNGKVPGTFVSDKEMNELGQLLASFRDYILSHEARLELIEAWINEYMQQTGTLPQEETDGFIAPEDSAVTDAESEGLAIEPTDDSPER